MAWEEELFGVLDDLEQQAEAAFDAGRDADLADRSRSASMPALAVGYVNPASKAMIATTTSNSISVTPL